MKTEQAIESKAKSKLSKYLSEIKDEFREMTSMIWNGLFGKVEENNIGYKQYTAIFKLLEYEEDEAKKKKAEENMDY